MSKNHSLSGTKTPLRNIRQRESAVPKHRYGRYQIADIITILTRVKSCRDTMARSQMQMAQTRRLYNYGLPLLRHKQCFGCCWQYLKSKLLIIKIFLHSYLYTIRICSSNLMRCSSLGIKHSCLYIID